MSNKRLVVEIRRTERNDEHEEDEESSEDDATATLSEDLLLRISGLVTLPPAIVTASPAFLSVGARSRDVKRRVKYALSSSFYLLGIQQSLLLLCILFLRLYNR